MGKNGINSFVRVSKTYMDNPVIRKEMLKNEVTKNILEAMKKKEVTKADLARKLNTTPSNVSQILNGSRNLTIDTICEISMVLGVISQISFVDMDSLSNNCFKFEDSEVYTGSLEDDTDNFPGMGCWHGCQNNVAYS